MQLLPSQNNASNQPAIDFPRQPQQQRARIDSLILLSKRKTNKATTTKAARRFIFTGASLPESTRAACVECTIYLPIRGGIGIRFFTSARKTCTGRAHRTTHELSVCIRELYLICKTSAANETGVLFGWLIVCFGHSFLTNEKYL